MSDSHLARDDHTHTIYSGHSPADSLVSDMVRAAGERRLKHLVVLEHLPTLPPGTALSRWRAARNQREHLDVIAEEIDAVRGEYPEMEILRGVEVDADPWALDGSLLLEDLSGIDVVVAATHVFPGGEAFWFDNVRVVELAARARLTQQWFAWVERIVESGLVDSLAHPGCLIGARALIDTFDDPDVLAGFARLAQTMSRHGVAFEINEALCFKLPQPCRESYHHVVRTAREHGARFTLGTDSHSAGSIGHYGWALDLMDAAGVGPEMLAPLARGKRGTSKPHSER